MNPTSVAVAAVGGVIVSLLAIAAGPALLTGTASACTAPASPVTSIGVTSSVTRTSAAQAPGAVAIVAGYDAEQLANASAIVDVGAQLGVPIRGWIIAVAVAIQESSLRNLSYGDAAGPDSRGLFQQRSAWGPVAERMNPAASTRLFFTGGRHGQPGLLDVPGWQAMPLTVAAQAVQRSAFPSAYAAREGDATAVVSAVAGGGAALDCAGIPGAAAAQAVAFARAQIGLPYQWAGDGLGGGDFGFDCSGLTRAAYAAAGVAIPRTAQTQYDAGPPLPAGRPLLPGDLLFYGSSPADVTHVGLYLGGNQMIDAPHAGAVVRVEDHRWSDYLGATRPASPPSMPTAATAP